MSEKQKSFWDSWALDRTLTGHKTRNRIIRILRLALPLLAVVVVGTVAAWPRILALRTAPETISANTDLPQSARNELVSPHFETQDSEGRPVSITAKRAVQNAADPALIDLERPMADMTMEDGSWLAGEADRGAYQQKAQTLLLAGKVRIFHDSGYEMKTEKLNVNLASREAWSDEKVFMQGPSGTLDASGVKMDTAENRVVFTGPARVILTAGLKGL